MQSSIVFFKKDKASFVCFFLSSFVLGVFEEVIMSSS